VAWSLRGATSGGITFTSSPQTLTLPVTTNTNDLIVVVCGNQNLASPIGSVSGAGGTWARYDDGALATHHNVCAFVGYGCSSGQTTITLTGFSSGLGSALIGVFSGAGATVPSVTSVFGTPTTATHVAQTTPSISYSGGDLLIGISDTFQWDTSPGSPSWSAAGSDNAIDHVPSSGTTRQPWASFATPGSSGSTTYTTPVPSSSLGSFGAQAILGMGILDISLPITASDSAISSDSAGAALALPRSTSDSALASDTTSLAIARTGVDAALASDAAAGSAALLGITSDSALASDAASGVVTEAIGAGDVGRGRA
jgi:hypothetical protein